MPLPGTTTRWYLTPGASSTTRYALYSYSNGQQWCSNGGGEGGREMGQQSSSTHDASLQSEMSSMVCTHAVRLAVRTISSFTAGQSQRQWLASTHELAG